MSNNGMATQSMEEFLRSMVSDSPVDERLKTSHEGADLQPSSNTYLNREHIAALLEHRPALQQFSKEQPEAFHENFKNPATRYLMLKVIKIREIYAVTGVSDKLFKRLFDFKRYPLSLPFLPSFVLCSISAGLIATLFSTEILPLGLTITTNIIIQALVGGAFGLLRAIGPYYSISDLNFDARSALTTDKVESEVFIRNEKSYIRFITGETFEIIYDNDLNFVFKKSQEVPEPEIKRPHFDNSKILEEEENS